MNERGPGSLDKKGFAEQIGKSLDKFESSGDYRQNAIIKGTLGRDLRKALHAAKNGDKAGVEDAIQSGEAELEMMDSRVKGKVQHSFEVYRDQIRKLL